MNIDQIVDKVILANGNIISLTPEEKVEYYKEMCRRSGLDASSSPFKIMKSKEKDNSFKEILFLARSGSQQLNRIHNVSHQIKAREVIMSCYQVTARATLPDGRHTESIGAVPILYADGKAMTGETLANAMMKAETKAKNRSTLDLLGLGILDEIEVDTIPNVAKVDLNTGEILEPAKQPAQPTAQGQPAQAIPPAQQPAQNGQTQSYTPFNKKYTDIKTIEAVLVNATTPKECADLYFANRDLVDMNAALKDKFAAHRASLPATAPAPASKEPPADNIPSPGTAASTAAPVVYEDDNF